MKSTLQQFLSQLPDGALAGFVTSAGIVYGGWEYDPTIDAIRTTNSRLATYGKEDKDEAFEDLILFAHQIIGVTWMVPPPPKTDEELREEERKRRMKSARSPRPSSGWV